MLLTDMNLTVKNLVDLDLIYQAQDVTTLQYLLKHYQFDKPTLDEVMKFALRIGHLGIVQDLFETKGIALQCHGINMAFSCGYQDLCRYLYLHGQRVDLAAVTLRPGVYTKSAEDVVAFVRDIGVDLVQFGRLLISMNNFNLCHDIIPTISNNDTLHTYIYWCLVHARHDVMQCIIQHHAVNKDQWQHILEWGIRNRSHTVVSGVLLYYDVALENIPAMFRLIYDGFGNAAVVKILIAKYDPDLTLYRSLHAEYWDYLLVYRIFIILDNSII